jgi:hypothetical protein
MSFFLTKSCFIHTPKCAGRWIKGHLSQACTVVGYNAEQNHYAPTWEELDGKKPFAFVRHPITWLASLHNHRMRKRGNWFPDRFPLEKTGHKRSNIVNTMKRVNALSQKEKEMLYDTQRSAFEKYDYSLVNRF